MEDEPVDLLTQDELEESMLGSSAALIGRDEMNLCEYPIALLVDRAPRDVKTVFYKDRDETLTITGSDLLGLPLSPDVDILIALLYLTKLKNNFASTTLHFTRYQLIEILGWPHSGQYYERITESLNKWAGVMLIYKKSWFDNASKKKGNLTFHILESVSIIEQADRQACRSQQIGLPLSSVRWSEDFFKSFQANNLKKLDLEVYFSLKSAISKQLYRFLDKRFWKKFELKFDLRALACEHVGLSRNYESWKLKQRLQPAIDELVAVGFLKAMEPDERYEKGGRGEWTVHFRRNGALKPRVELSEPLPEDEGKPEPSELEQELLSRKVTAKTVCQLVKDFPEEQIRRQIEQLDWEKKGRKKISDPAAYLVKAIRDDYAAPEGFVSKAQREAKERAESEQKRQAATAKHQNDKRDKHEAEIHAKIQSYWDGLSEAEQKSLKAEALKTVDPELRQSYLDGEAKRELFAEALFKISIRNPFIREKLGL
jgi:hypothetical protein